MLGEQDFFVEPVSWRFDADALRAVRREVFIVEQQVPEDEEWDDHDETAQHFLARSNDGEAIGTARLTRDGHIGRMAVIREWRGRHVGDALLRSAIEFAAGLGRTEVRLMAQVYALPFYRRHGFEAYGEVFDDVGIDHQWMARSLQPEPAPEQPIRRVASGPDEPLRSEFSSRAELGEHFLSLITHV